ncbi:MAG: double-strand break repair protein AddB [Alphaproteobacteria bacterium]|nr:double-strand break repair protein AddB [Alphaproteobacteria bacterium]
MGTAGRIFNIPAGIPFADAFAGGLLARHGADPLALARVRILLPNRRAQRALREAFLRQGQGRPMLLPLMRPLGDVDEEEQGFLDRELAGLPPAIGRLERQLLLMRLIRRRPEFADAAQAARLAAELASLIDEVLVEQLDFAALADLAPEEYAGHWQITLEFLRIVTAEWPLILAERGQMEQAARRNELIARHARLLRAEPPDGPVYVAGSTGSVPATAGLMAAVLELPQGALVLPGLDQDLDETSWQAVGEEPTHPQHGLFRLLARLAVPRAEIRPWPWGEREGAARARARLVAEALRPAATTDLWRAGPRLGEDAVRGLSRIDAPGPEEEAGAIAILMREALEIPGRTAALVTPDRSLARRVAADLRRYGIEVDDSAGSPLGLTPPGSLLRLSAEMLASDFAPVPLLAACKHPLSAGGGDPAVFRRMVRQLEIAVLRGPRPGAGLAALRRALAATTALPPGLLEWLDRLAGRASELAALGARGAAPLRDILRAHVAFAEWLASDGEGTRLWAGEAGEVAARFVADLLEASALGETVSFASWPALLAELMAPEVVRPRYGRHPRLFIWGPLEARLQHADLVILGGLNEGTWPAEPPADPWMSRPMRARFGLPPAERRIGQAAHDFQQAAGSAQVVLSRTGKREGAETVPSRWLLRLENLLSGQGLALDHGSSERLLAWQAARDRPEEVRPCAPPEPRPPLALRPRRLPVTAIERWLRDPYAIHARYILRLRPLAALDEDPGARDRGNIVHEALDRFVRAYPADLPADARSRLVEIGREAFGPHLERPGVRAFWWPRFLRIVDWFLAWEHARRADGIFPLATETSGQLVFDAPGGPFQLRAKIDRIDRTKQGLVVLDYKTGRPPSRAQVESGLAPQLPLEAAILAEGGIAGVPLLPVESLDYLRLSGGRVAGEHLPLELDAGEAARTALVRLQHWVAAFDDPDMPYRSRPRPKFVREAGDYDHLARVREWSAAGGEE